MPPSYDDDDYVILVTVVKGKKYTVIEMDVTKVIVNVMMKNFKTLLLQHVNTC